MWIGTIRNPPNVKTDHQTFNERTFHYVKPKHECRGIRFYS